MRRFLELVVLTKGNRQVADSLAHGLERSHFGVGAPRNWITKNMEAGRAKGMVVMLWSMRGPKGLKSKMIKI